MNYLGKTLACLLLLMGMLSDCGSKATLTEGSILEDSFQEISVDDEKLFSVASPTSLPLEEWPRECRNDSFDAILTHKKDLPYRHMDERFWNAIEKDMKLYYCLSYPETWTQVCYFYPYDSLWQQKVAFHIPIQDEGLITSKRQKEFVQENRGQAIALISDCLVHRESLEEETKQLVLSLNFTELIPGVVKVLEKAENRDTRLLSLLLQWMEKGGYPPLKKAPFNKKVKCYRRTSGR